METAPPTAPDAASRPQPSVAATLTVGAVAAAIGAGAVYLLSGHVLRDQLAPLLVVGPLVGLAVRLLSGRVFHAHALLVAGLAFLGAVTGFVLAETALYTPFMLDMALRRAFGLVSVIVLGVTTYLAYIIVLRRE